MIYWDTCLVIYDVAGVAPFAQRLRAAHETITDGDLRVSDLVRLECLVLPLRLRHAGLLSAYQTGFATLETLELDRDTYLPATELRAEHRLKTPDALHAACAIRHGCRELWTDDGRFSRVGDRLTIRVIS